MDLVKIGDTYVNKDYVTGIRVSPFNTQEEGERVIKGLVRTANAREEGE